MKEIIFPTALKKGDKIAIISPAGAVEESQLYPTLDLISDAGYLPIFGEHTLGKYVHGYAYSGTEKERIQDLNWAFNDPSISAIWATRGGYGCQHLLPFIRINEFLKAPKWYIGYSDNTVIQSYLLKKGVASIHGQTIKTASFGVSPQSYQSILDILEGKKAEYALDPHRYNVKGKCSGPLVGGNLALIYALLGSKFSFDFKNSILFIEEIGEQFYALDRMMMALEIAGVFKKISGLIIGGMTNMGKEADNPQFESSHDDFAYQLISERLKKYSFPILFGFPNGHIFDNQPLILGQNYGLTVSQKPTLISM